MKALIERVGAQLMRARDDERGLSTAELLGNAALAIAALVVIWAALEALGVEVVTWIRGQIMGGGWAANGPTRFEHGFATAQFMVVVALSMLFLAALLNLIAIQYAQGVVRAALDEGVRLGSVARASDRECLDGIRRVMSDLLSGPLGAGIEFTCTVANGYMVASAESHFDGWFPGMPSLNFSTDVHAVKESDE